MVLLAESPRYRARPPDLTSTVFTTSPPNLARFDLTDLQQAFLSGVRAVSPVPTARKVVEAMLADFKKVLRSLISARIGSVERVQLIGLTTTRETDTIEKKMTIDRICVWT